MRDCVVLKRHSPTPPASRPSPYSPTCHPILPPVTLFSRPSSYFPTCHPVLPPVILNEVKDLLFS